MTTPQQMKITLLLLILPVISFSQRLEQQSAVMKVPIIGGAPAQESQFPEIVRMRSGEANFLTGVIVGPRVVLSAAHGVGESSLVKFEYRGKVYNAIGVRSPLYPEAEHDLAVAITLEDIRGFNAASVSRYPVAKGESVHLLGFGCLSSSGADMGDLHIGEATVINTTQFEWISKGAALCFGDSGGPAYPSRLGSLPERRVLGIGSKGNIKDTSYFTRLDSPESIKFFKEVVQSFEVDICGFNADCDLKP